MWTVSPILSDVCALFKSREMKGRAERLWVSSPACDRERGRVTFNLLQFLQPVTLSWLRNTHTHRNRFTHRKHNKGRWTESEWSVWRTWITAGTSHITRMLAFPTLRNANSPTLTDLIITHRLEKVWPLNMWVSHDWVHRVIDFKPR